MKVITTPTVHLLSLPRFFPIPDYDLPADGNELEKIVATAGKLCYDSFGIDGNPVTQHVMNLVNQGHGSVLEHVNIGVVIRGVSRGLSHEAVRHRHFGWSQRSTRYTAEEEAAIVLDPYYVQLFERWSAMKAGEDAEVSDNEARLVELFILRAEQGFTAYREQLELLLQLNPEQLKGHALRKWARGKARQLLPHALETRLTMTGNVRAWRHFFNMRSGAGAEAEIRRLAHVMWPVISSQIPSAFHDALIEEFMGWEVYKMKTI